MTFSKSVFYEFYLSSNLNLKICAKLRMREHTMSKPKIQEGELMRDSTISKMEMVQQEGNRQVKREQNFYNLDVIIYYLKIK